MEPGPLAGPVGPFPNPVVAALVLLVLPALVVLAIYRGERARREGADALVRARTGRTYLFFACVGAFVLLAATVAIISEPAVAAVGMLGGPPIAIVAVVGFFHALMVWRVRLVQILVLSILILPLALVPLDSVPFLLVKIVAAAYGLGVVIATVRGFRGLQGGAAS